MMSVLTRVLLPQAVAAARATARLVEGAASAAAAASAEAASAEAAAEAAMVVVAAPALAAAAGAVTGPLLAAAVTAHRPPPLRLRPTRLGRSTLAASACPQPRTAWTGVVAALPGLPL